MKIKYIANFIVFIYISGQSFWNGETSKDIGAHLLSSDGSTLKPAAKKAAKKQEPDEDEIADGSN